MAASALGTGLELVGSWVGCALGLVRRMGAPLLEPIIGPAIDRRSRVPSDALPMPPAPRTHTGAQAVVEEAKYWLAPSATPSPGAAVDREPGILPPTYGRDRIVFLPRDPWWAFTYWEITPTSRVRALRALGADGEGASEVLRVYDVTFLTFTGDNAWLSVDVELPPGTDHRYLELGRPGASFCVEIGLRTRSGRFLPLARSNVITTPRSFPSPDTTARWVDLRTDAPRDAVVPPWSGTRLPDSLDASAPDDRPHSSDVHAPRPG
jgi:hypothetical protein